MRGFAPRQIVLATDFSPAAAEAMRTAVLIGDAFGAELTVIFADEVERPVARAEAQSRLQRWIETHASDHGVHAEVANGSPVDALLHAAKTDAADLIVLGAHPRHGIERFYLGHFAEAVLRASTIPVLTVRRGMRAIRTIVCGVDCTAESLPALEAAIAWGDVFHAQVNVVNIIEPDEPGAHIIGELESWIPPDLRLRCQCKELVIRGGSERLVAFAGALKADLMIVGGRRNVVGDETPLPDTTSHVVRRARCAVLAMIEMPVARDDEETVATAAV